MPTPYIEVSASFVDSKALKFHAGEHHFVRSLSLSIVIHLVTPFEAVDAVAVKTFAPPVDACFVFVERSRHSTVGIRLVVIA